eukprot:TRINITY_DN732_c0_g1_i3.p1 TRINITY_DN732_c0_g1~~TRINITY_DN732_c0_g1_i3.p1  ORF type:complete len:417 (+),score=65.34 TRINITY_DN732_c0_g1_i3:156-1406(+)
MLQCLFLLSDSGEVMLEKQWLGQKVDRSICHWFWEQSHGNHNQMKEVPPVVVSPTHYLIHIVREGIIFLACVQNEMPPLLGIEFLGRVADILSDYVGGLNEDNIKDNFVIVYQVLDEMMDNGFPLTTEPNVLKDMISPPNIMNRMLSVVTGGSSFMNNTLPGATSSNVPWRSCDLKRSNNEVYVDLIEEMDAVVNRDGCLVKCEIYGKVHVNSQLSGLPDLTLTFVNPSILNDVRFHPCVRFRPWESNQVLSFVPPDGEFTLMSYRVKDLKNTPIYVRPQFSSNDGSCKVDIIVGLRNDPGKPVDSIVLQFPLPPYVTSSDLTSNHGNVNVLTNKTCSWSIGRIPKDKAPCLTGNLKLESGVNRLYQYPTILVGFKIMGVALSGLKIDKVDVPHVNYHLYKGYRAMTRAAGYEIRT